MPKITLENGKTVEISDEEHAELEKKLEFPQIGDEYFCLDDINTVEKDIYEGLGTDRARREAGNCFQTEEEVELEQLRRESIANRWVPKVGEDFFFWDFANSEERNSDSPCVTDSYIGSCHKTTYEVYNWYKKYGKAFEAILK